MQIKPGISLERELRAVTWTLPPQAKTRPHGEGCLSFPVASYTMPRGIHPLPTIATRAPACRSSQASPWSGRYIPLTRPRRYLEHFRSL